MNSFKDLEQKTQEEYPLPLGIKSNVQNQLGGMRTFGNIIEVYLSRVLDILSGMFGGDIRAEANTHMMTLFTPTKEVSIDGAAFLTTLHTTFDLSQSPKILWVLPAEQGVEVSIKLTAKDATKLKRKIKGRQWKGMQVELR